MTPLERVAELAPTLKEAELRVLLYLAHRALAEGSHVVSESSREISIGAKVARSNVVRALDALADRCLITTRQGTARKSATYQVNVLATVPISGPTAGPLVRGSGPIPGPPPALFQDLSGLETGPPPAETAADATLAASRVGSEGLLLFEALVDRIRRASPKKLHPDLITTARARLHGYMRRMGPEPHAHPPDELTVAQFLAIGDGAGEWPALDALLNRLFQEGQKIREVRYGWFITVAMQRIHGISVDAMRQQRKLRVVGKTFRSADQPGDELEQLALDLHNAARMKRLG